MSFVRCAAVLNIQHRCKIPMVQLCQQQATVRYAGVPLCGTHVNHTPTKACVEITLDSATVEKL